MPSAGRTRDVLRDISRAILLGATLLRWGTVPLLRLLAGAPLPEVEVGRRLRLMLAGLGLTFMKLGQYLAMRVDVLPPGVCSELDKLFDRAPAMSFSLVERQVEAELGASLGHLFSAFDRETVGAASVAQVHRAVARDGEVLAIKVQRPGIGPRFESDIRNLLRLARFADRVRLLGRLSLAEIAEEFGTYTRRELDFVAEATTADLLRRAMLTPGHVPRVRWDLTTSRVLAMEFVDGISLLTLCSLPPGREAEELERLLPGVDLAPMVRELAAECFHQFFDTGLFQGDPHPANFIVRPDGTCVFVDFGIYGQLGPRERRLLRLYIENLARGRLRDSARGYARLCEATPWTDVYAFERDLEEVLAAWFVVLSDPSRPLAERHMARWQGEIVKVLRRHDVRLRREFLLVWRAMVILDTTVLRLPVEFDLLAETLRFFSRRRREAPLAVPAAELAPWAPDALRGGPLLEAARLWRAVAKDRRLAGEVRRRGTASGWRRQRASGGGVALGLAGVALATLARLPAAPAGWHAAAVASAATCLLGSLLRGRT
jgi:ubiquinone biosynthesis protein